MLSIDKRMDKLESFISQKKPLNKKQKETALKLLSDVRIISNVFRSSHLNMQDLQAILRFSPTELPQGLWISETDLESDVKVINDCFEKIKKNIIKKSTRKELKQRKALKHRA